MDMKKIPIFFSFDNNYVPQAAVAFESLLTHAKEGIFYELFVLHTLVSLENQGKLSEQVRRHSNANLQFIDVTNRFEIDFSDEKYSKSHSESVFTVDTLYRCLPTLISEFNSYDKIIYSDVDIVVVDDISELYDLDLREDFIGAVRAPAFLSHQVAHLGEEFLGNYFGGGLWVMNLKAMREGNLGEEILGIIQNPPVKLEWLDQDVMNLACKNKTTYFSYRYVSIPSWLDLLEEKEFYDEYYPNGEFYEAMYEPKIIHYAATKPWGAIKPPKSDLWYYWLSKTPFYEEFSKAIQAYREDKRNKYDQRIKLFYRAYLFGFLPLPFTSIKGRTKQLKMKLLGLPLFEFKLKG